MIHADDDVAINKILVFHHYEQTVSGTEAPVEFYDRTPIHQWGDVGRAGFIQYVEDLVGRPITSFHGCYRNDEFDLRHNCETSPPPPGAVGDPCETWDQCSLVPTDLRMCHWYIDSVPIPGGYCSGWCTEDTECGENGACASVLGLHGEQHCVRTCASDADCRTEEGDFCAFSADGQGPFCFPAGAEIWF